MDIGITGNFAASAPNASTVHSQQPTAPPPPVDSVPVQTEHAVQQAASVPSSEQIKQAVQETNNMMQSLSRGLEFYVDESTEQTVVKVIDKQTEEVIRQIPSEEMLAIAESLDQMLGKLIKEKA